MCKRRQGRCTNFAGCDSHRHGLLSVVAACSCARRCPAVGAKRGGTDAEGSDPPCEGLVRARGRARFHTPVPAP